MPNGPGICGMRLKSGMSMDEIHQLTNIDHWFLDHLLGIVEYRRRVSRCDHSSRLLTAELLREAKQAGFSDRQMATSGRSAKWKFARRRKLLGVVATFKSVDTCAAEFEAYTPLLLLDLRTGRRNTTQS